MVSVDVLIFRFLQRSPVLEPRFLREQQGFALETVIKFQPLTRGTARKMKILLKHVKVDATHMVEEYICDFGLLEIKNLSGELSKRNKKLQCFCGIAKCENYSTIVLFDWKVLVSCSGHGASVSMPTGTAPVRQAGPGAILPPSRGAILPPCCGAILPNAEV